MTSPTEKTDAHPLIFMTTFVAQARWKKGGKHWFGTYDRRSQWFFMRYVRTTKLRVIAPTVRPIVGVQTRSSNAQLGLRPLRGTGYYGAPELSNPQLIATIQGSTQKFTNISPAHQLQSNCASLLPSCRATKEKQKATRPQPMQCRFVLLTYPAQVCNLIRNE